MAETAFVSADSSESIIRLPTKCTRSSPNPLARKVRVRTAFGRVEQCGDLIGKDSVDFFGHRAIEAA